MTMNNFLPLSFTKAFVIYAVLSTISSHVFSVLVVRL